MEQVVLVVRMDESGGSLATKGDVCSCLQLFAVVWGWTKLKMHDGYVVEMHQVSFLIALYYVIYSVLIY